MYETRYHRPATLAEAEALLSTDEAKLVSGGQTLIPTLKQRLAAPQNLIDIWGLAELRGIAAEDGMVSIGASVTHADVAASDIVRRDIPGLAELAGMIGDPQVRHRGTLGGSVANNDPAADYPAAVLALSATIRTTKASYDADSFFVGMFETALAEDEIVCGFDFPIPLRSAYMKFRNPASRYAMAGVFVAQFATGVRVAVTGAAPAVFRVPAMEDALSSDFTPEALDGISVDPATLISDLHAAADYRAHLVVVMARRAVASALARLPTPTPECGE